MLRGGGVEQGMTRLRLAPRSLWGPLGPLQSPPLTAADSFYPLSSPSCSLFLLFISLPPLSLFLLTLSSSFQYIAHDVDLGQFLIILPVQQLKKGL